MSDDTIQKKIDEYIAASRALNGHEVRERSAWNTTVTPDAIRHFAYGISDDNPLWIDPDYASNSSHGRLVAPPAFLNSVLYPIIHGAPIDVPLSSFIGEVEYRWFHPVLEGDSLRASAKQVDVLESMDRKGRRCVSILSETRYWNQHDKLVGKGFGTLVRVLLDGKELLVDRPIYQYSKQERERISEALKLEFDSRVCNRYGEDVAIGHELPIMVRGPLTVGDMVCWHAAIGPSYRAGSLGYMDIAKAPHTAVKNPITGWPVKFSQQHEDFQLTRQRGMSVPFDNGVMRFAWLSPLLTNWMGDNGTLKRLSIQIIAPNLYGDTTWYRGVVSKRNETNHCTLVTVKITGTNQIGICTTRGEAEIALPMRNADKQCIHSAELLKKSSTVINYPRDKLFHEMFEIQAQQTPEAIAVIFNEQRLTYQKLNQSANRLAHYLRSLSVGPDMLVGIYAERSIDIAVGILATLKAGGAYVPLDPEYPKEHVSSIIQDTGISILITQEHLLHELPRHNELVLCIESVQNSYPHMSEENPVRNMSDNNLAYVIYTSGSISHSKGVAVSHLNLSRYINSIKSPVGITDNDVYLHTASFSFSAAVRQMMLPLSSGATLVISNFEEMRDPLTLYKLMKKLGITIWDTVPAVWSNCIDTLISLDDEPRAKLLKNELRLILVTGEPLAWDIPQVWISRLKHNARILNLYSQTETAGTVSYYPVPRECSDKTGIVPLGRPIENTQMYLLDEHLKPVPYGNEGEICVGGDRLAEGYLNRKGLTSERFIPDPFSDKPGARLYRTRDIGRSLPDGTIEFMGRLDHQIKLRGFRIEPAEIETSLRKHPDVREAVIIAREQIQGDKTLVAYVVPHQTSAVTIEGRKRYPLPNNMAFTQLNKHETDFSYQTIFEHQTYLKHGVTVNNRDCIFDVGANTGLFSLFVSQACLKPRIYSFEPNPVIFNLLKANASLYNLDIRLFQYGLSDKTKNASFTFYLGSSLQSGFYPDVEKEKEVMKTVMKNQKVAGMSGLDEMIEQADFIVNSRFAPETYTVGLRTLSSVIKEEDIECINLLKINVEKSELNVLRGIERDDWKKIEQIVLKAENRTNLDLIVSLLDLQGYDVVVDQDTLLENTQIYSVYAIRPSRKRTLITDQEAGAHILPLPPLSDSFISTGKLTQFLNERLPHYMIPSIFVFLEQIPLTRNGKVDREKLPSLERARPELGGAYKAPRNAVEEVLIHIWADVLGLKQIGIHDNFFEMGGHSLLVTRIISRLRDALEVEMPLKAFFEKPTVESLVSELLMGIHDLETIQKRASLYMKVTQLSEDEVRAMLAETSWKEDQKADI